MDFRPAECNRWRCVWWWNVNERFAFVPDEHWEVEADLVLDATSVPGLAEAFTVLQEQDSMPMASHQKRLAQWRQDHGAFTAKLVELDGEAFKLGTTSEFPEDLSDRIAKIAASVGIEAPEVHTEEDPKGKGPAKFRRTVRGRRSRCSIRRLRNRTQEPKAQAVSPFITSTLQMAASSFLGFGPSAPWASPKSCIKTGTSPT